VNFAPEDIRFADEREVAPPEFGKLEDEAFDVFFAFHAIAVSSSGECGLRPHFCILRA
jgi:D-serine dehydratase